VASVAAAAEAAGAVQDLAEAELVDPEAEAAPVGAAAPALVEVCGKREKLRVEAVAAEAEELAREAEDQGREAEDQGRVAEDQAREVEDQAREVEGQEAEAAKVAADKAPEVAGVVEVGAEPVEAVEELAEVALVALAAEVSVVEVAGVELEGPAALEEDPAAVGEVAEAREGVLVETPAQVEGRVDPAEAEPAEVLAVAELQVVLEAQEPSLANG
jgi:hypothetical protein